MLNYVEDKSGCTLRVEEAIQRYGADAVFTASAAGACEDYEPLRALGLHVDSIEAADQIGTAVYRSMTAEEKAALHWEASQDLYKSKEPVNWDNIDFQIAPRSSDESEVECLHRQLLGELIQEQIEKRRKQV